MQSVQISMPTSTRSATVERTPAALDRHLAAWDALVANAAEPNPFYEPPLAPGDGVHVPVNAPHYVLNGPQPSVSFSITFRTPEGNRRSAVYRVNDRLRALGLRPRPVGATPLVDRAKYVGYALYERARRTLGRGTSERSHD